MTNERSHTAGGICGQHDLPEWDEVLAEIRNDYRWTPPCQRAFLEELAASGSVMRACQYVGKAARGAYGFRHRREGAAFRLGWDAAVLVARCVVESTLMDRAMNGYQVVTSKDPDGTTMRGTYDNRLGQGLLTRLDRMAEAHPAVGSMAAQIQLVSQDWESFLELIEQGGTGAAAALFCAARSPVSPSDDETRFDCELAQISAAEEAEDEPIPTPEEAAEGLSVWYDAYSQRWMTDFPPHDAKDADLVTEHGKFGDEGYIRTLTLAEEAVQIEAEAERLLPLHIAAHAARDAWFEAKAAA